MVNAVCLCSRGIWTMPSLTCFNFQMALDWSGNWTVLFYYLLFFSDLFCPVLPYPTLSHPIPFKKCAPDGRTPEHPGTGASLALLPPQRGPGPGRGRARRGRGRGYPLLHSLRPDPSRPVRSRPVAAGRPPAMPPPCPRGALPGAFLLFFLLFVVPLLCAAPGEWARAQLSVAS